MFFLLLLFIEIRNSLRVCLCLLPSASLSFRAIPPMKMGLHARTDSRNKQKAKKTLRGIFAISSLICKWSIESGLTNCFRVTNHFLFYLYMAPTVASAPRKSVWFVKCWNMLQTLQIITFLLELSGTQHFPLKHTIEYSKEIIRIANNKTTSNHIVTNTHRNLMVESGEGEFFELIFRWCFLLLLLLMRRSCQFEK